MLYSNYIKTALFYIKKMVKNARKTLKVNKKFLEFALKMIILRGINMGESIHTGELKNKFFMISF